MSNTVSLPLIADNYHPGQTRVQLALSATDDLGGVAAMTISNVASFAEAQWEPYAPEKQWWAHDSATATVYVIFRDKAGNQSTVYSDSPPP